MTIVLLALQWVFLALAVTTTLLKLAAILRVPGRRYQDLAPEGLALSGLYWLAVAVLHYIATT